MKTILKFFKVILFISCSSDDDSKEVTQTCLTEDLGITDDYKNPYPEFENNAG